MNFNPKLPPWAVLLAVPAALLLMGCCSVNKAMFPAPKPGYSDSPEILKLDANGAQIAALYLKSRLPESKGCILYSHGNAEDLGRLREFLELYAARGYDVFAYDYCGYGLSQGSPSQSGCLDSIAAAYAYLTGKLGVAPESIIVYGRSVGSGPSVWLASERKVGALALEAGFTSTYAVVLGVDSVPTDKFQNLSRIKSVSCPVFIAHGRLDGVIPFKHGEALYAAAKEPKACLWAANAGHDDIVYAAGQAYWDAFDSFAAKALPRH